MIRGRENYDPSIYVTRHNEDTNSLRVGSVTFARTVVDQYYPNFNLSPLDNSHHMCELYSLDSPEGRKILKIFPYPRLAAGEIHLLNTWQSLGIPVATITQADLSYSSIPYPFTVMDFIPFDKEKDLDRLDGEEVSSVLVELANYLRMAHQVEEQSFGWINYHSDRSGDNAWSETVRKILDGRGKLLVTEGVLTPDELRRFENVAQESTVNIVHSFLLHGDLTPSNILFKAGRVAGFIDPDPIGGDGLYDLAYLLTSSMSLSARAHEEFALETYLQRKPTNDEMTKWRIYKGLVLVKQTSAAIKWNPEDHNLPARINKLRNVFEETLR